MEKGIQRKQPRHVLPTSGKRLSVNPDRRPRLLLVEDEAMLAIGEQRMLEGYGYQVVVAGTGEQALEICNSEQEIDLILMDIRLGAGRLSGPETAIQILKTRQLPVIFLSSYNKPEIVAQTENISMYGYVVKSSDGTMLNASIKMALRMFEASANLEVERGCLQTTLDLIGDAVIATDAAGRITRINPIAQNLTGWNLEDALGKPVQEVVHITNDQSGPPVRHPVHAVLEAGGVVGGTSSSNLRAKDGTVHLIEDSAAPIKDSQGSISGAVLVFRDITRRNETEVNLRETQEQLALFFRHSPIHAFLKAVTERESRLLFASENFSDLLGLPGSQLPGKTMEELFPLELASQMTRDDWSVVTGDKVLTVEEEFNGRHYSSVKFPITQRGGKLLAGYSFDITERRQADEKIKTLLGEKERLLDEVHHRIKNVLYSINSLLTLQASAKSPPDGRVTLLEAANRVRSMMMLYEKLQESSDYLSVSSQAYLSSLAVAIVASFSGNIPVTLEKSIEDCLLSAEKCQPLGLILNELLTNVMRHAFVGKDSGKVAVTFCVDEGQGVLVVQDDGLGLPASINLENSPSLGLKLVNVLSRQIGGAVRVERGYGTKVIVEFPNPSIHEEGG